MSVGSRIKEARIACGFTQEKLAELLSISKGTIGNYESDTAYPRTEILYRLCSVLNCDANFIYQDDITVTSNFPIAYPEIEFLKKYRSLDDHGMRIVNLVLNEEVSRISSESTSTMAEQADIARDRYGSALKSSSLEYPSDLKEAE